MEAVLTVLGVLLGVLLLLGLWVIILYNLLVKLRNHVDESWSDIDTELKRRHDLIPNLVETVKGYAAHEKNVLERVVRARQAAMAQHNSPAELARDENELVGGLRQLFAVAEGYPVLKANENFLHLQQELINTEDRVQRARRFYNANVRDLNTKIDVFPSNVIARMFTFGKREFFEIESADFRQPPAVKV